MIATMLQNPHISEYLLSLEPDLPEYLEELRETAEAAQVPIIRREAQALLRFLVDLRRPEHILEVGTAVGFSACYLSELAPRASITTIEKVPAKIAEAKKNFARFGKERIRLLEGDAADVLRELSARKQVYDFVFLDAAKAQYGVYLPYLFSMLAEGGLLITDNVLQEGSLADSKFTVTRRNRTIHMRMREYVGQLFAWDGLTSVLLPVGDGMALSVRRTKERENGEKRNEE
ncbi:MAG: O-methyltransferase [Lachnospiraceae bacterium]|nr:O-methyltransferase [Lachnospiraceae bacterium]